MIRKIRMQSEEGFTLIELMIVIAIIGILAAIAIPNFIAYRNKSFCSAAESDANAIAAAVADYFAIPTHTLTPSLADIGINGTMTGGNVPAINGADPNTVITITIADASNRCPDDYEASSPFLIDGATRSWVGGTYTKELRLSN